MSYPTRGLCETSVCQHVLYDVLVEFNYACLSPSPHNTFSLHLGVFNIVFTFAIILFICTVISSNATICRHSYLEETLQVARQLYFVYMYNIHSIPSPAPPPQPRRLSGGCSVSPQLTMQPS
jgi:hypothetical protein